MSEIDAVSMLTENTKRGVLSVIEYEMGFADRWRRLVEACGVIEGESGSTIVAMQYEPEVGRRHFHAIQIVHVERTRMPLRMPVNPLLRSDVSTSIAFPSDHWFSHYLSGVRNATMDRKVTQKELESLAVLRNNLMMSDEQMRAAHAYLMAELLLACCLDGVIDTQSEDAISDLSRNLKRIGWSPR